jgi:hypothetical protein
MLLNLSFLSFIKKSFSNFFFFNDTVADWAVLYTLCERYTLYAHCTIQAIPIMASRDIHNQKTTPRIGESGSQQDCLELPFFSNL